ncbi:MAG: type II secretion system protein [Planctomycetes bacterium]|nr:type II secretion system protein [Planctomycetota bacterium]
MKLEPRSGRRANARRGVTLVEVVIAMPIILVAASLMLGTLTTAARQRTVNGDNARAAEAVRSILETLRNEDFRQMVALFDQEPFNDPLGPGTAPGNSFDVPGLRPLEGDLDGRVGEILLPLFDAAPAGALVPEWQLREDIEDAALGLPQDLNGDGAVDSLDHSGDNRILPVVAVVRWQGQFGPRTLRMFTLFTEYRY